VQSIIMLTHRPGVRRDDIAAVKLGLSHEENLPRGMTPRQDHATVERGHPGKEVGQTSKSATPAGR